MYSPIVENSAEEKFCELSNYFDIKSRGVNMVWPTGVYNQQQSQHISYSFAPIWENLGQVEVHSSLNNFRQGHPPIYNSPSHNHLMYHSGSTNYVKTNTDLNRIQAMGTTIEYLRGLLSTEYTNNAKERTRMEEINKELEASKQKNKLLQDQLQAALISIKETQTGKKEIDCVDLSAKKKELTDAQSELIVAQNIISDLKVKKTLLESKVLGLSSENGQLITTLEEKVGHEEKSMSAEESHYEDLRAKYELRKDELIATIEKKNIISNQFKELGKKYLLIIEYSGEQMYNDYLDRHVVFIKKLQCLNTSASEPQSSKIKQMLACLQEQVELLEKCRQDFHVTIELLMGRIDQEFALVSDFSIRPPKPSFEIPLEDFDLLYQLIAGIGFTVELDSEQKS